MKKIRITEGDLHKIIKKSVAKILREYNGDVEELGRYDIYPEDYNMSDEEYADLKRQQDERALQDYEDEEEYFNDYEAEQAIGQDFYDPGDESQFNRGL